MEVDFNALRAQMVRQQISLRGIHDVAVLEAMGRVPREQFLPAQIRNYAYDDTPLPIGNNQTMSQPYIVALMAQAASLTPKSRCLEIGSGSGYSAAVLSRLCLHVDSIERIPELVNSAKEKCQALGYSNIHIICGDGTLGRPESAPYDAIVVTAGAPVLPKALLSQLNVGGSIIIPVGELHMQELIRLKKVGIEEHTQEVLEIVRFVPLLGEQGWPSPI